MYMQAEWIKRGYIILRQAVDVSDACEEMKALFPLSKANPVHDFGNEGEGEFPCGLALDKMTVHPKLLSVARELLGTHQIELTQSVAWAKYGCISSGDKTSNRDQRMHMDYGNHYWGMPPRVPDMVAAIIYYSNTSDTGGATAVVPRQSEFDPLYERPFRHMPGVCGLPFVNSKYDAEQMMADIAPESAELRQKCYERELVPTFRPGDVLLYRMDCWHRGTPVRDGAVRYVHNLAWKKASAKGIQRWNPAFTRGLYSDSFVRFLCSLEPYQLETIGFPSRTSSDWEDEEFCEAMRQRYEWAGFDLESYVQLTPDPPPVPQYWFFSKTLIHGDHRICKLIFETLSFLKARVKLMDSNWHWRIECDDGSFCADMYMFKSKDGIIVDMNRLQGDRWSWYSFFKKLKTLTSMKSSRL